MLQENSYTRITLCLDIVRCIDTGPLRGYHELQVLKHRISLFDTISVEESAEMSIECDNPLVPCDSRNLCWKAAEVLKAHYAVSGNAKIKIQKRIPVQGGLAGGSANAATALGLLARMWGLNAGDKEFRCMGQEIGMDVPYYFGAATSLDSEAGGEILAVETDASFHCVLYVPDFGVSTRQAYSCIDYAHIGREKEKTLAMADALRKNDIASALQFIHNDFEHTVFKSFPKLNQIKKDLLNAGAVCAVLSGSGSTLVGFAENSQHAARICSAFPGKTIAVSSYRP